MTEPISRPLREYMKNKEYYESKEKYDLMNGIQQRIDSLEVFKRKPEEYKKILSEFRKTTHITFYQDDNLDECCDNDFPLVNKSGSILGTRKSSDGGYKHLSEDIYASLDHGIRFIISRSYLTFEVERAIQDFEDLEKTVFGLFPSKKFEVYKEYVYFDRVPYIMIYRRYSEKLD